MTCLWCIRHIWNRYVLYSNRLHLTGIFNRYLNRFCQLITGWSRSLGKGISFTYHQLTGNIITLVLCHKFHNFFSFGIRHHELGTTKSLTTFLVQFQKLDVCLLIYHNRFIIFLIRIRAIFLLDAYHRT